MKIKNHVGTGTPARPVERSSTAGVLEAGLRHPERSRFSGEAKDLAWTATALALACILTLLTACSTGKANPQDEAPPKATVVPDLDANNFQVSDPNDFPLVTAAELKAVPALNVTGLVQPDITRAVPVTTIATGRVVELKARLGDTVQKGQVLLRVRAVPALPGDGLEHLVDVGVTEQRHRILTGGQPGGDPQVLQASRLLQHVHAVRDGGFPVESLIAAPEPALDPHSAAPDRVQGQPLGGDRCDRPCGSKARLTGGLAQLHLSFVITAPRARVITALSPRSV